MHRDISPANILIDHEKRELKIIGWGKAEFFHMTKEYKCNVASREFKTPELLTGLKTYDYAVDMFSLSTMFAQMIFKKFPFFKDSSS
jgi:casein kinase II subunit alpha